MHFSGLNYYHPKTGSGISSNIFRNLPAKYVVKEEFELLKQVFIDIILADEQIRLMATYPAFREIAGSGFKDVRIKLVLLKILLRRNSLILKKNYGDLTDTYFDGYGQSYCQCISNA